MRPFFCGKWPLWVAIERGWSIREGPGVFLRWQKPPLDKAKLGPWGEKCAERLLKRKGLKTLARNVSCKTGELDLVMVDTDGTLVFVEVKTRGDEGFAPAEAAITQAKKRRMVRAVHYFLTCHDLQDRPCRFDVVAIVLNPSGRPEIRHYENAFVP